jgi:DNA-binding beta-propeller fold protein YncE
MKTAKGRRGIAMNACLAAMFFTACTLSAFRAPQRPALRLVQTIALPEVEGRIDHFALDVAGERLFMAALGNNTVEVFNLRAGGRIKSLAGLHHPQGVRFIQGTNRLFVANAQGGEVVIFDAQSLQPLAAAGGLDDADNIRYDSAANLVYVGYGEGALAILDARNGVRRGDIKLPGHPESFQLANYDARIFVNIPDARQIAVLDRTQRATIARWPLDRDAANFPMALDEAHHRLFVACRRPAELLVLDSDSGEAVARLPCVGDADDLWYDAARNQLYISGGEGAVSIIAQRDADHYQDLGRISTALGARTSFFSPELNRLYVAVPHRGSQRAELRVYETEP